MSRNSSKKAKYELTDQNSGTSNSVDSCSKNFAENANRSIEETDQQYAEKIQLELNQETDPLSSSPSATSIVVSSLHKFLKRVALKVYTKDQVFIIMRKGTFLDWKAVQQKVNGSLLRGKKVWTMEQYTWNFWLI